MQFSYQLYNYSFKEPLITHYGTWTTREGIIISLIDHQGKIGQGEIAPLTWFGSETLQLAISFCEGLKGQITEEEINNIPDSLPCSQFALSSAIFHLSQPLLDEKTLNFKYSSLLRAGDQAIKQLQSHNNPMTFKWKIGVYSIKIEQNIFLSLIESLPTGSLLRLDANGGLTLEEAQKWLSLTDNYTNIIEYLEQPLSPENLHLMLHLNLDYFTPIALDESVAGTKQIEDCYLKGWRGIYVIKAPIAGSTTSLRQICLDYQLDTVFSSVFETYIGRSMSLYLAKDLANSQRALGYSK